MGVPATHPVDTTDRHTVAQGILWCGGVSRGVAVRCKLISEDGVCTTDLLALIPGTPTASKLLGWGIPVANSPNPPAPVSAPVGARYEDQPVPGGAQRATPLPRKPRKITKDMISHPTGFMSVQAPCAPICPTLTPHQATWSTHPTLTRQRHFCAAGARTAWARLAVSLFRLLYIGHRPTNSSNHMS